MSSRQHNFAAVKTYNYLVLGKKIDWQDWLTAHFFSLLISIDFKWYGKWIVDWKDWLPKFVLIPNTFLTLTTAKEQVVVYFYFQNQNIDSSKITTNKIRNVHRTNVKIEGILGKKIDWQDWLTAHFFSLLIRVDSKWYGKWIVDWQDWLADHVLS